MPYRCSGWSSMVIRSPGAAWTHSHRRLQGDIHVRVAAQQVCGADRHYRRRLFAVASVGLFFVMDRIDLVAMMTDRSFSFSTPPTPSRFRCC